MDRSQIDRRQFLKQTAAATTAAAIVPAAAATAAKPTKRPNVLYVFSDQHRALSLPGEAFNQALAPNFDKFRHESLSMDNCISNYPLCTPHRAILISGRYSCQTGIIHNGFPLKASEVGLGTTFANAGYHTGYIGKWHLSQEGEGQAVPAGPLRFGFEHWYIWANTNKHYDDWTFDPVTGARIDMPGYQPTRMTDQAIDFINHQKNAEKPWFLVLSWNPPHPPFNPPDEELKLYDDATLKLRPNVRLPTAADKLTNPYPGLESLEDLRKAEQGYYGGISAVDKEFARLLKTLEENGMSEDTVVIYTSDHGEMMGSHGHMAKQMPHEESCRVPFFVRWPGFKGRGEKSDALFASVDIYPTLCGLAGIPVPQHCSGHDMSSLMHGDKKAHESEYVFLMNEKGPPTRQEVNVQTYRGVRTKTHTYAVQLDGRWCLYDNIADPYQMKNLVKDPAQRPLIDKLDAALMAWMKSTGDTFPYATAIQSWSTYPGA
ncbi:MAG: sulfatase [Acidobacteriota bacterium]